MANRPPFLTLEERVDYLYKKDYFARDTPAIFVSCTSMENWVVRKLLTVFFD